MRRHSAMIICCIASTLALPRARAQSNLGEFRGDTNAAVRSIPPGDPNAASSFLDRPVEHVRFDDTPFEQFVDWLRALSTNRDEINVIVRWRALDLENVRADSPVTLEMKQTTVKAVLNEVLDQLSDLNPLNYAAQDNILRISTKSDLNKRHYVRVYDIHGLLDAPLVFRDAPQIDLQSDQSGGAGAAGRQAGAVTRVFNRNGDQGGGRDDESRDPAQRARHVMDIITKMIEPDSWEENGGAGAIAVLDGQLIVRNSASVHHQLAGLFAHQ